MPKYRNFAIVFALIVVVVLTAWLSNMAAQTQSTTIVCPAGQKPQTVSTGSTGVRVTCVASSATPTPTPSPTPTPTPTPVVCTVTCGATVPATATLGVSVQFASGTTISNCSGNASFDWNFGDGTSAFSQNQVHTYSATGSYTWTLAVNVPGTSPCIKSGVIVVAALPVPTPTPTPPPTGTVAEMPRAYVNSAMPTFSGATITVNSGGDLQAALNAVQPGGSIVLQAGATFTGNFILPNKTGTAWIAIRSSAESSLPPQGTRVSPANAGSMPKIVSANADPAIKTTAASHNYRFIGIEMGVRTGTALIYSILQLGENFAPQATLASVPMDFVFDRCYIHGNATGDVQRCVGLNSGRTAVIDSHISDCHTAGFDSQAICGWNGPGPYKIVNNRLEGAGENFMIGGADPAIPGLVPADIEFRRNHVFKPLSWKQGHSSYAGQPWSIKNLFELKSASRVWVDGNIFENNWQNAQDGFAIVLKVQNQDGGAPQTITQDVTFTNNEVKGSPAGINFLGNDPYQSSQVMQRILIRNNIWAITSETGAKNTWMQICCTPDVTVDHNSVTNTGTAVIAYGEPTTSVTARFVFADNTMNHNEYGVIGDGTSPGNMTINKYFPAVNWARNVLVGANLAIYPPLTFSSIVAAPAGVGADKAAIDAARQRP